VLPFFSTEYLPEQRGTPQQVTDFRKFRVTRATRPAEAPSLANLEGGGDEGGGGGEGSLAAPNAHI